MFCGPLSCLGGSGIVGWTSSIMRMQLEHHMLKLHVSFIHFSLMTIPSVLFLYIYIYIVDHRAID